HAGHPRIRARFARAHEVAVERLLPRAERVGPVRCDVPEPRRDDVRVPLPERAREEGVGERRPDLVAEPLPRTPMRLAAVDEDAVQVEDDADGGRGQRRYTGRARLAASRTAAASSLGSNGFAM